MKHFSRPYRIIEFIVLIGTGASLAAAPPRASAQSTQMVELLRGTIPLLVHSSVPQGYLGVWVDDVDSEKAQTLKLKEARGALITLVDHDAPAGQIGLRVNDVVLQLNGQNVEGAEQLRRMLKEIPPGRKVSLEFSRDGNLQTTSVELVDHRAMEHDVWNKLGKDGDVFAQTPAMGVLPGAGDATLPGMFHMPIFGSTLNVGALVEPLTGQMAEYLGVPTGLMIKQVAHKSEAASAGFKAFDVILKVGTEPVTTLSDWDRALRSNQGKQVQVTILRDKKQQTLTLQVDSKRKTGDLQLEDLFVPGASSLMAELDPRALQLFGEDYQAAVKELRDQLNSQAFPIETFQVDSKQMEALKRQMHDFRKAFDSQEFKFDSRQFDELNRQMEEFRKDLNIEGFEEAPN